MHEVTMSLSPSAGWRDADHGIWIFDWVFPVLGDAVVRRTARLSIGARPRGA